MGLFDKLRRRKKTTSTEKTADVKDVKEKKAVEKKSVEKKPETKKAEETKKEVKSTVTVAETATVAHRILLQPVLSEKSFKMAAANKYVFRVNPNVNKYQIKTAIKELYGVKPVKVNIVKKQPVTKYRWGRRVGRTSIVKKALVTMPEGTVLNLTE